MIDANDNPGVVSQAIPSRTTPTDAASLPARPSHALAASLPDDHRRRARELHQAALAGGTQYTIGCRAYNGSGEEANAYTVSVTADATGPSAVTGLTASTTY